MSLIKVAIDRLLKTDPAEWLGHKLTEPQDPMPETIGEAMDMIKAKAKMAIDSATQQLQQQLTAAERREKGLRDAVDRTTQLHVELDAEFDDFKNKHKLLLGRVVKDSEFGISTETWDAIEQAVKELKKDEVK